MIRRMTDTALSEENASLKARLAETEAALEAFVDQHHAGLVPDQHLDPVRPLGAEHEGGATEGIEPHHLLDGQGEAVDALAEVDRSGGHVDA